MLKYGCKGSQALLSEAIKVSYFSQIQVLSSFNSNLFYISSFVFSKGLPSFGLLIVFKGIPLFFVLIKLGSNNGLLEIFFAYVQAYRQIFALLP